ncbi:MAG: fasciclin domain-containing protein [Bacteroidia bacterium]
MKKNTLKLTVAVAMAAISFGQVNAQMKDMNMNDNTVMVGGESMFPKKNIIENAVNSKDHTTLVAAVKAAGLVETLQGKGPFTVFAPVNNAFEDLPAGTVETLLKPENKGTLTAVLTYHVLAGKYTYNDVAAAIKKGNGKATMKTVQGQELTFMMNGMHNITVTDAAGNSANISTYDVMQSNGVIHVIDKVLMPKM